MILSSPSGSVRFGSGDLCRQHVGKLASLRGVAEHKGLFPQSKQVFFAHGVIGGVVNRYKGMPGLLVLEVIPAAENLIAQAVRGSGEGGGGAARRPAAEDDDIVVVAVC